MRIETICDFRRAMRIGPYAWPGGYPVFFVTDDGAALSYDAARANRREIISAIADNATGGGWRVAGLCVNYENGALFCDHTGARIPSAYGDGDE